MEFKVKATMFAGSLVMFLAATSLYSSHAKSSQLRAEKSLATSIQEKLPPGSKVSQVLVYLDGRHIEHSAYLPAERKVIAIIRKTSNNFLIVGDAQAVFEFDKNGSLIECQVKGVYTGP